MKIAPINKLCLAALLALGAVDASLAAPPQGGRPMQGPPGDFRQPGNDFPRQEPHSQMAAEQEQQRRAGKLSPDERRELRRQINEVGQDIYRVKR